MAHIDWRKVALKQARGVDAATAYYQEKQRVDKINRAEARERRQRASRLSDTPTYRKKG
jgi:hypothetical protein